MHWKHTSYFTARDPISSRVYLYVARGSTPAAVCTEKKKHRIMHSACSLTRTCINYVFAALHLRLSCVPIRVCALHARILVDFNRKMAQLHTRSNRLISASVIQLSDAPECRNPIGLHIEIAYAHERSRLFLSLSRTRQDLLLRANERHFALVILHFYWGCV